MEAAAAGKLEGGHDDFAAGLKNGGLGRLQILRIEDNQRGGFARSLAEFALAESAIDASAGFIETDVVGSEILKIPAKDLLIEALAAFNIGRRKLDIVDAMVLRRLSHCSLQFWLGCAESRERRLGLQQADTKRRDTLPRCSKRLHPHSLRSRRVQVEPAD